MNDLGVEVLGGGSWVAIRVVRLGMAGRLSRQFAGGRQSGRSSASQLKLPT